MNNVACYLRRFRNFLFFVKTIFIVKCKDFRGIKRVLLSEARLLALDALDCSLQTFNIKAKNIKTTNYLEIGKTIATATFNQTGF